jgi:uncharacterized protein YqiB (DUF1249 family)
MLDDSLMAVSWRARPRSFVALMSLYESNHVRFGWLAGAVRELRGTLMSRVTDDCDLCLSVIEHSPYTSTFNLTYLLPENGLPEYRLPKDGRPGNGLPGDAAVRAFPDVVVRVYHDARLVEAQQWAAVPAHAGLRALRGALAGELDQRWARNMMLNKWLEYCVERGHRFMP